MFYLLIAFIIFFAVLAWRNLDLSLMLMLFLLPSYQIRFSILGLPSTLLEIMLLICFFVWLIKETEFKNFIRGSYKFSDFMNNRKKRAAYPFGVEIIFFLIASFLALGVAHFSNQALGVWKAYFFEAILFYILLLNRVSPKKNEKQADIYQKIEKFLWPLILSALFVSGFAIFQKLTGLLTPVNFWPRVTGVFTYPNALGLFLAPLVLLMISYGLSIFLDLRKSSEKSFLDKPEKKSDVSRLYIKLVVVIASITFSLLAIFLARSEGAMIGILIALFLLLLYFFFSRFKRLKFVVPFLSGLIFIFVIFSPWIFLRLVPEYAYPNLGQERLNEVYDKLTLKDFSGEVRKQQWRETFTMMAENGRWFFGTGLSGYQSNIKPFHQEGIFFNAERDPDFRRKLVLYNQKYRSEHWRPVEIYMYPHNLLLNFWTELGLLGVLAFVLLLGRFFYTGYKLLYVGSIVPQGCGARDCTHLAPQPCGTMEPTEEYLVLGLLLGMMVLVVHGMVDVPFFKNDLAVIFFFLFAMMEMLSQIQISKSKIQIKSKK